MAIIPLNSLIDFPGSFENGSTGVPSFTSATLNAAGDKVAFVIQCPKAGTLELFEWRTGAVANNPDNGMRVSFQTIDPATGAPDGVVDQFFNMAVAFSANAWQIPSGPITSDGTGGGVKRVVTQGEWIGCVVDFVTFVALDSIVVSLVTASLSGGQTSYWYVANGSTGTYVISASFPCFALKYDDATYAIYPIQISPALLFNTRTFNTGTTPDERALRFQVPIACRIVGAWFRGITGAVVDIILYDNADAILTSISIDPDIRSNTSGVVSKVFFEDPIDLTTGTTYRLSMLPTSASSVTVYDMDINSAGLMAVVDGGAEMYSSTRTNAGAWTDNVANRPLIGLIIDGFDTAASGGGETSHVF